MPGGPARLGGLLLDEQAEPPPRLRAAPVRRTREEREELARRARDLRRAGYSYPKIAAELSVSISTAASWAPDAAGAA